MVRARSPQKMSYQFINRDADNKLVTNHSVGNHHPQFVYDEAYKQLLLKIKSTFIGNN